MNTVVTSKEQILAVSRELIQTQGWNAINIRSVASACNISIGTIYNYFHSKSDLVTSTIESVWCDIFPFPESHSFHSFSECIRWIFDCIKKGDEKYPGLFTLHSMSFIGIEKSDGQERMAQSWSHIQQGMIAILQQDPNVRRDVFDTSFTEEQFVKLIFTLIISALVKQENDPSAVLGLVERVLYC